MGEPFESCWSVMLTMTNTTSPYMLSFLGKRLAHLAGGRGEVEPVCVRAELQSRDSVLACVQHLARLGGAHWPSISRMVDLF